MRTLLSFESDLVSELLEVKKMQGFKADFICNVCGYPHEKKLKKCKICKKATIYSIESCTDVYILKVKRKWLPWAISHWGPNWRIVQENWKEFLTMQGIE